MTGFTFTPATQQQSRLRLGLVGPAGAGKTFTALRVGSAMGQRIALIDTERGSASKYANLFAFDQLQLTNFNPDNYVAAIRAAEEAGYQVLIIDSLSHAWMGEGGALQMVDQAAKRSQSGNSFAAWRDVTPVHNKLVDAMLGCKCHLVVTMRAKTEWVLERDEKTGKNTPRKIGMAPIQRDGMEYEFDVVGDLDQDNNLIISKSRCPEVNRAVINRPGEDFARTLLAWLGQGQPTTLATPSIPAPLQTPAATISTKTDIPRCDVEYWNKTWHATVANTPLADDDARHRYIEAFTKRLWAKDQSRQTNSLSAFLRQATEEDASSLIAAVTKSLQQRLPQAERVEDKAKPVESRETMEALYSELIAEAIPQNIDLTPFEIDTSVSDVELGALLVKLHAAVRGAPAVAEAVAS